MSKAREDGTVKGKARIGEEDGTVKGKRTDEKDWTVKGKRTGEEDGMVKGRGGDPLRNMQKSQLEKLMANPVRFASWLLAALYIRNLYCRTSLFIFQRGLKDGSPKMHQSLYVSTWVCASTWYIKRTRMSTLRV